MRSSRPLIILATVMLFTLGGCAALGGLGQGVYAGGDIGAHKEIH